MRLPALACLLILTPVAHAQYDEPLDNGVRVSYDYGFAALGDILDNSLYGEDGWESGMHQALSVSLPFDRLGADDLEGFSLRLAWVQVEEDTGRRETKSFPGLYLAATASGGDPFGYTMDFFAGYDLYNKEGNLWLTWIPTIGAGIGPHLQAGPVRIEALFAGQFTSLAQGAAVYGRLSAVATL